MIETNCFLCAASGHMPFGGGHMPLMRNMVPGRGQGVAGSFFGSAEMDLRGSVLSAEASDVEERVAWSQLQLQVSTA